MMLDPNASFSPGAAAALNQALAGDPTGTAGGTGAQVLEAQLVAEPAALAVWGLASCAGAVRQGPAGRRPT